MTPEMFAATCAVEVGTDENLGAQDVMATGWCTGFTGSGDPDD